LPIAIGNIVNLYTSIMEDKGLRPQLAKKHGPARTGCGFFSSRLALYHESNFNPEKERDCTR
jgi:hypothetical protein